MSRLVPDHARSWIVVLAALAILLPACGRGRKKYLEQVTPLVEQNDMIDARFAELPKVNAYKNPDYLPRLDGYIASKQALLNQMEAVQPPFLMTTTHAKLVQSMKNG
ncbi:MAG: hypothetical protein JSV16_08005, partial [Candidatus Hydrogenedentota bacterium]